MRRFKSLYNKVKASRSNNSRKQENSTSPNMTMPTRLLNEIMEESRMLIRTEGPITEAQLLNLKEKLMFLVESGNEQSIYTHKTRREDTSLLCESIRYHQIDVLRMLIETGVNVNSSSHETESYNLPLHFACYRGEEDCAALLIEHGANPYTKCKITLNEKDQEMTKWELEDTESYDASELAIQKDNADSLKIILQGARQKELIPPYLLHKACRNGKLECAKIIYQLFPEQAKVNDDEGCSVLHYAFNKNPKIAMYLAETHPDCLKELTTENTYSKLLVICSSPPKNIGNYERAEGMRFLLKYGDSSVLSRMDSEGNTALHYLCLLCGRSSYPYQVQEDYDTNLLTSIKLLIQGGGDPNVLDGIRYTPLVELLANKKDRKLYEEYFDSHYLNITYSCISKALRVLLEYGANVDVNGCVIHPLAKLSDIAGKLKPYSLVSAHPYIKDMISNILEKGASPNTENSIGCPVFMELTEAYLGRDYKIATTSELSCQFSEIVDLFIAHKVTLVDEITLLKTRKSNYCKELLYMMMFDLRSGGTVRQAVIESFSKMLDAIKIQDSRLDLSDPQNSEWVFKKLNYTGKNRCSYFCIYIYKSLISTESSVLFLECLRKLCDVASNAGFKKDLLQAAKVELQHKAANKLTELEDVLLTLQTFTTEPKF